MHDPASERADVELLAWTRFVDRLGLDESVAMRLVFVFLRVRHSYLRD